MAEFIAELHAANDEVDALRRVATLVAQGVPSIEIFSAVSDEVGRLFGSDISAIVRFERDGTAALMGVHGGPRPPGARVELEPGYVVASVRRTARTARFDTDDPEAVGMPQVVRTLGIRSGLASPIVVDGELWGAITLASLGRSLPPGTERQLAGFTELIATALANAQARDALSRLADEQAGLRRVATLVARGVSPDELFAAVSNEVATLFGAEIATIGRFELTEPPVITAVGVSEGPHDFLIGLRSPLMDWLASTTVYRMGRTARREITAEQVTDPGTLSDAIRAMGFFSTVSAPIVVEGELWGVVTASSSEESLPADTERRIESFSELVATAIANAQSRGELATSEARARALAEEQAALRRVATLVAGAPLSEELFSTVAREVATVLNVPGVLVQRFETDGAVVTFGVAYNSDLIGAEPFFGVGSRMPPDPGSLAAQVFETHCTARVNDYSRLQRTIGDAARAAGLGSGVAGPIVVDGELWGQMCVFSTVGSVLPGGTENRLRDFIELVATAISNYEAHAALQRLADEQAALRRIATLVAEDAPPSELFRSVTHEVGTLLDADFSGMARFEDGAVVPVATWAAQGEHPPVPDRWPMQPGDPVTTIAETQRAVRWDDWTEVSGPVAAFIRDELGVRSTAGTPIVLEGRPWGALAVHSKHPLPQDSESRIKQFSDLVATAIGNAEARAEVARLANEQAALRRVATLVAHGARPAEVFAAVSQEVGQLFGSDTAAVFRFDSDHSAVVVVGASRDLEPTIPVGTRLGIDEPLATARVYRTGRSARFDAWDRASLSLALADAVRRSGVVSTVASPIIVEGRRWGAVTAASKGEPLPLDAGERLERFSELVATAIANTDSRAELAASRKRIVAAWDEARRRIERDLHDGTQQRLVWLGLAIRAAEASVPPDQSDLRSELSRIASGLGSATAELQEISRGIHPAILAQGGLATALRTLARRSTIPVKLQVTTGALLPEPIEVAAYYVASEALANTAKHAQASRIDISLERRDTGLLLEIRDDGVGGADLNGGSGLLGLSDRVEALGGSIRIQSQPGNGTSITVELPLEPDALRESPEST